MILAVLLDGDGRPVCTEMWPGNTAETIAELEARGLLYVLGVRERTDKLVRELVLDDPAPFVPFILNTAVEILRVDSNRAFSRV